MKEEEPRPRKRGVYVAVAVFYTALFFAVMWPIYPQFATIEPRILELPFSLVYVVIALLLSFFGLLALYIWESKQPPEVAPDTERESS